MVCTSALWAILMWIICQIRAQRLHRGNIISTVQYYLAQQMGILVICHTYIGWKRHQPRCKANIVSHSVKTEENWLDRHTLSQPFTMCSQILQRKPSLCQSSMPSHSTHNQKALASGKKLEWPHRKPEVNFIILQILALTALENTTSN